MKKRMKSFALFFFILSMMMTFFPSYGAACSCVEPPSVKEEFSRSKAVFSGKVTEIAEKRSVTGIQTKSVLLEVNQTWKGVSQSQVMITTGTGGGDCGYEFKEGQEYLVYANDSTMYGSNKLTVIICSRTNEINAAQEDLAVLGEGQIPAKQVNPKSVVQDNNLYVWIVVLTAVTIIAFFARRRFKKRLKK